MTVSSKSEAGVSDVLGDIASVTSQGMVSIAQEQLLAGRLKKFEGVPDYVSAASGVAEDFFSGKQDAEVISNFAGKAMCGVATSGWLAAGAGAVVVAACVPAATVTAGAGCLGVAAAMSFSVGVIEDHCARDAQQATINLMNSFASESGRKKVQEQALDKSIGMTHEERQADLEQYARMTLSINTPLGSPCLNYNVIGVSAPCSDAGWAGERQPAEPQSRPRKPPAGDCGGVPCWERLR